jgi:hypothetical protein
MKEVLRDNNRKDFDRTVDTALNFIITMFLQLVYKMDPATMIITRYLNVD